MGSLVVTGGVADLGCQGVLVVLGSLHDLGDLGGISDLC